MMTATTIGDTCHIEIVPEQAITPFFTGHGETTPLIGPDGKPASRRWGMVWRVPLFEFRNDRKFPLTFHDYDGTAYQPDNHFTTDGGSVPPLLWNVPFLRFDPQAFPRAYPLHDSAFHYGGLYVRKPGRKQFRFAPLERAFCDGLLRRMVVADGAGRINAGAIRFGVWCGSRWAWDEQAQAAAREKDGVKV
jgi:hypothetical protein